MTAARGTPPHATGQRERAARRTQRSNLHSSTSSASFLQQPAEPAGNSRSPAATPTATSPQALPALPLPRCTPEHVVPTRRAQGTPGGVVQRRGALCPDWLLLSRFGEAARQLAKEVRACASGCHGPPRVLPEVRGHGVELSGAAAVPVEEERGGRAGRRTAAEPVCGRTEREGSGRLRHVLLQARRCAPASSQCHAAALPEARGRCGSRGGEASAAGGKLRGGPRWRGRDRVGHNRAEAESRSAPVVVRLTAAAGRSRVPSQGELWGGQGEAASTRSCIGRDA